MSNQCENQGLKRESFLGDVTLYAAIECNVGVDMGTDVASQPDACWEDGSLKAPRVKEPSLSRTTVYIIVCVITVCTSGGLILGFGPFYTALVGEGQWHELCPSSSDPFDTCPAQEAYLQRVFTTGFLLLNFGNAVFGSLLDIIGPRWSMMLALGIELVGTLCLAYGDSSQNNGVLIIMGYAMIGCGGMGYITSYQFTNLFDAQGLPSSILSSLFNMSGFVYMLLTVPGITRKSFFVYYTIVVTVCMIVVYFLYPHKSIEKPNTRFLIPKKKQTRREKKFHKPTGLFTELIHEICRVDFLLFLAYFGWMSLIVSFVMGAFPDMLSDSKQPGEKEMLKSYHDYAFPLISNASFLFAPFVGMMIDRYGFSIVFVIAIFVSQLLCVCLLTIPELKYHMISFFVLCLMQAFVFSLQFSYILMKFPKRLYGLLQSVLTVGSFCICLVNYGLTDLAQNVYHGNNTVSLWILFAPTTLFYLLPVYLRQQKAITIDDVTNSWTKFAATYR